VPLVTTNYDDLIEKATPLRHVRWTDAASVSRFVRGDERRVLHLHGHWEEPDSVVLGIRSYEAVKNNEHTQAVLRAMGVAKSFLFVGCGDEGLADPNFGNFLAWLAALEAAAGVEHRHYRLARRKDGVQPYGRYSRWSTARSTLVCRRSWPGCCRNRSPAAGAPPRKPPCPSPPGCRRTSLTI